MDKYRLKIVGVLIVTVIFSYPSIIFSLDRERSEAEDVLEDIRIINLLNNLDLRDEQMEAIIKGAEEVKAIRDESRNKIYLRSSDMKAACEEIKGQVAARKVILDEQTAKNFREIKDEMEKMEKNVYSRIDEVALRVEGSLEQFQLNALDSYKPCIVPIVSKGRIGQADSGAGITKLFERVKELPEEKYEKRKEHFVYNLLEAMKKKLPIGSQPDETNLRSKILVTLNKVRAMSDVDFQLKKEEIAEDFHNSMLPNKKEMPRKDKIKKLLLCENIIPILKERLNTNPNIS
jgi:hypothetical protein